MENIGVTVPSMVILKIGQLNIRGSTYQQIERTSSSEKKNSGHRLVEVGKQDRGEDLSDPN